MRRGDLSRFLSNTSTRHFFDTTKPFVPALGSPLVSAVHDTSVKIDCNSPFLAAPAPLVLLLPGAVQTSSPAAGGHAIMSRGASPALPLYTPHDSSSLQPVTPNLASAPGSRSSSRRGRNPDKPVPPSPSCSALNAHASGANKPATRPSPSPPPTPSCLPMTLLLSSRPP